MNKMIIRPDRELIRRRELGLKTASSVHLPYNIFCKVKDFSKKWAENKRKVGKHYAAHIDGQDLELRSETGTMVEAAVEQLLQVEFIDWDPEYCLSKDHPDLDPIGIDFGVKGGLFSYAPIINTETLYPQIIGLIDKENPQLVHILGAFTMKVLNNQDFRADSLKINYDLSQKKSKTGFFALDLGHPLHSIKDLEKYCGDLWLTKNREKYSRKVSHAKYNKHELI